MYIQKKSWNVLLELAKPGAKPCIFKKLLERFVIIGETRSEACIFKKKSWNVLLESAKSGVWLGEAVYIQKIVRMFMFDRLLTKKH